MKIYAENTLSGCTGRVKDTIRYLDGREEIREESFNTIVDCVGILAAALFKNDPAFGGIKYWAIGSGNPAWDATFSTNPPIVNPSSTNLVNEIGRKAIPLSAMAFVDDMDAVSTTPTNKIWVKLEFDRNDFNNLDWREFGLFGGDASSTANSGIMINQKFHKVISKTDDMTVERNIIFTFN